MELTRSIVSRLRQYVGDRRHAKRQKVRLPFSLSMASSAKGLNGARRIQSLGGHTLDLSPNGLALIVPAIRLGDQHLVGEHRTLNVKLELPSGAVEMQVTPIRYETFEEHESQSGYIIGVKITAMPEEDRATFTAYVSELIERKR
ncbi:MAG: PilZ domain-containing protein [Pyrinomonadaceae bacterium]|nr:PilZ domain-containing protein [Pyrinomonadaceae bacterium]